MIAYEGGAMLKSRMIKSKTQKERSSKVLAGSVVVLTKRKML
jgi:hypothetical protein